MHFSKTYIGIQESNTMFQVLLKARLLALEQYARLYTSSLFRKENTPIIKHLYFYLK